MDVDDSAEPGMPLIKHLYSFGHMGFVPLACTTPNGPTSPSAIAARDNFARYNLNSWLEIEGALHAWRIGRLWLQPPHECRLLEEV
jgi:hypothetical protein